MNKGWAVPRGSLLLRIAYKNLSIDAKYLPTEIQNPEFLEKQGDKKESYYFFSNVLFEECKNEAYRIAKHVLKIQDCNNLCLKFTMLKAGPASAHLTNKTISELQKFFLVTPKAYGSVGSSEQKAIDDKYIEYHRMFPLAFTVNYVIMFRDVHQDAIDKNNLQEMEKPKDDPEDFFENPYADAFDEANDSD